VLLEWVNTCDAARCSGVQPSASLAETSAPSAISCFATGVCPHAAAQCSGHLREGCV